MTKKKNTTGVGTRSKRLALLLLPSLYVQVKDMANAKGYSVNDMIHKLLQQAVHETKGAYTMKEFELKYGCNPNQKPAHLDMLDGSNLPFTITSTAMKRMSAPTASGRITSLSSLSG